MIFSFVFLSFMSDNIREKLGGVRNESENMEHMQN